MLLRKKDAVCCKEGCRRNWGVFYGKVKRQGWSLESTVDKKKKKEGRNRQKRVQEGENATREKKFLVIGWVKREMLDDKRDWGLRVK